jgi:shikimate 5-dehydrogenase
MNTTPSAATPAGARSTTERLAFVGVTTGESSIMKLFPAWADYLGIDAEMVGVDLALQSSPGDYRECVARLAGDASVRGALVTTHKAAVFDHARDLFDRLDPNAELCHEISCIARRDGALTGWAKDPITAGQALDHLLGPRHFADRPAHAVCLGAGGAGLAIVARLLTQDDRPDAVVLVDRDEERLALARDMAGQLETDTPLHCLRHEDAAANDELVAGSPAGSLIINATGMGKDTPGAPITEHVSFPSGSIAWDLNYRGELEFLRLAGLQPARRAVRSADGWRYFLHGWTEVIAEVFELELTPERFDGLAAIAGRMSGRTALDDASALADRPDPTTTGTDR